MAKTLNHYSQQIKALAPDAVALDRAKQLGDLLLQAKAAVKAAGKLWTDWLQSDCELTTRTAQRFMTIATRWDDPAFTEARSANPQLAIREADKVLAANSPRKRQAAKELTTAESYWFKGSEANLSAHYCPHPLCTQTANAFRYQRLFCGGRTVSAYRGGAGPSSMPRLVVDQDQLHDPVEMVSCYQGGDACKPEFIVHPVDMCSYVVMPQVVELAKQIRTVLATATWFEISSAGHRLEIGNAEVKAAMPAIHLDMEQGQPIKALVGSILKEVYIYGDANAMETKGDCRELIATWELLRAALGWEA